MPTNLAIDDKLIEEARLIGLHRTKKAVITEALVEYIQRRKQVELISLFGTKEYQSDYNLKNNGRLNEGFSRHLYLVFGSPQK